MSEPWWVAALPELDAELRRLLHRKLPSRTGEHDDLVNETLAGVTDWMRRHEALEPKRVADTKPVAERRALSGLARAILNRRIADRFRLDARTWRHHVVPSEDWIEAFPGDSPTSERLVLLRRMLEVTATVLAEMSPEDRDLVSYEAAGGSRFGPLSPRERQRLRRARKKMARAILDELGESAAELLGNKA